MGDEDEGDAQFADEIAEVLEDACGGELIHGGGRFVGENDGWAVDEGAGNGDALALAAGELCGKFPELGIDIEAPGDVFGLPPGRSPCR